MSDPGTTTTSKGLQLPCPRCGAADANISVALNDPDTFTCHECDAEFSRGDIEAIMARWVKVLGWIDTMPGE